MFAQYIVFCTTILSDPIFISFAAEEGFAIDKLKVVDDTIMADWKTLDEIKRAIKKDTMMMIS